MEEGWPVKNKFRPEAVGKGPCRHAMSPSFFVEIHRSFSSLLLFLTSLKTSKIQSKSSPHHWKIWSGLKCEAKSKYFLWFLLFLMIQKKFWNNSSKCQVLFTFILIPSAIWREINKRKSKFFSLLILSFQGRKTYISWINRLDRRLEWKLDYQLMSMLKKQQS